MIRIVNTINNSETKRNAVNVVTHDGIFHGDEVFAVALLQLLFSDINVLRTRDPKLLNNVIDDPMVFVLDVGNDHNPSLRNFDHHQPDALHGLSTISLLFFDLFPEYQEDKILNRVYRHLIRGINEWDQGNINRNNKMLPLYLPQLISAFNRYGKAEQDTQFLKAVDLANKVLANEMNTAKEMIKSEKIWSNKVFLNKQTAILEEHCVLWRRMLSEDNSIIKYVIQPNQENWLVESADSRLYPLPKIPANNKGLVFQHSDSFISIFDNYEAAISYIFQNLITNH